MFARREQSVAIGPDAETRALIVADENRFDRRAQLLRVTIVG